MPRREPHSTSHTSVTTIVEKEDSGVSSVVPDFSQRGQIDIWADLVAGGAAQLPPGLSPDESNQLLLAIRQRRHRSLVRLVAAMIAKGIRDNDRTLQYKETKK